MSRFALNFCDDICSVFTSLATTPPRLNPNWSLSGNLIASALASIHLKDF